MSSQERSEHVSANSSDTRRHSNRGRCLLFVIIVFVFPIFVFILPYLAVYIQVTAILPLLNLVLFGLVFCLGILIVVLVLDFHPNWRTTLRHHFFGTGDSSRSSQLHSTRATSLTTQYSSDTRSSMSHSKPVLTSSLSTYSENQIWPSDVLPLNDVIQRLPRLESLVEELQELIVSSSLQLNVVGDINREMLIIQREATNQLLASLRSHLTKKTISLDFYLQKRKHLMATLRDIKAVLGDQPVLTKVEPLSSEKSKS